MTTQYFLLHLLPCRPDFAFSMSDEERTIMTLHVAYWKQKMSEGKVIVFGPVFDPNGPYGLGIVKVDDEEEVKLFIKDDPASQINQYEYFPMNAVVPNELMQQ